LRRGAKLNRRQKREVKTLIGRNIEKKFVEGYQTSVGIVSSGSIYNMNVPAQGDTIQSRTGDKITVTAIDLRYECIGYDTSNKMRVIVFKWMEDNASIAPNVSAILSSTYTGTVDAPLAPYNYNNQKQRDFMICYDKTHALSWNSGAAAPGNSNVVRHVRIVGKKLHSKAIEFNAGAVQTGEGIYYILAISDSGVAGHPKFAFLSRTIFTDA